MGSDCVNKSCEDVRDLPCAVLVRISKYCLDVEEVAAFMVALGIEIEGDFANEVGQICKERSIGIFSLARFSGKGRYVTINDIQKMLLVTKSEHHVRELYLDYQSCPQLKGGDLVDIFRSSKLEFVGMATFPAERVCWFTPFILSCTTIWRVDFPREMKETEEARVDGGAFELLNMLRDRRRSALRGKKCLYTFCRPEGEDSVMLDCHLCGVHYHDCCSSSMGYHLYGWGGRMLHQCDICSHYYCGLCDEMKWCRGSLCRNLIGAGICSGCVNFGLVNVELVPRECQQDNCGLLEHNGRSPMCDACMREEVFDEEVCSECYRRREMLDGDEQANGTKHNPNFLHPRLVEKGQDRIEYLQNHPDSHLWADMIEGLIQTQRENEQVLRAQERERIEFLKTKGKLGAEIIESEGLLKRQRQM